ncbi:Cdc6/Cdc18 family protein [Haloarchaeobius amylolyticus]|uniref:Cdc6/Cdc18 family protein n=1 Tax=Haloarchaeobius amylolyticus TaxID=1198296 RepID=UPI0022718C0C|nr:AAA family ATPase [Haloarchaeobius amylolyticus]
MDLKTRIRRRQRNGTDAPIILEYDAISPVVHMEEPTGRGPVMERLLDYLDPVFDRDLPMNAYVWGPAGSGKSAVLTSLTTSLDRLISQSRSVIHTTTRAQTAPAPTFVYVDARQANTDLGLYHAVLDSILDESVPKKGVGSDALRSRLADLLSGSRQNAVVTVDHVGEPGTLSLASLAETFGHFEDSLAWIAVGRDAPGDLPADACPPEHIEIPAYERHALVDVLTGRASDGLARQAIEHGQVRRLADWADGDAHDALAGLFSAAHLATVAGHDHIRERDLEGGMDAVPRPSVSLGRVLTLPANRQLVLRQLLELDETAAASVSDAAEAIASAPDVDLSAATVKRFLYELAEAGITERVRADQAADRAGRPPSRLEPRFATLVFRRLYDLQNE